MEIRRYPTAPPGTIRAQFHQNYSAQPIHQQGRQRQRRLRSKARKGTRSLQARRWPLRTNRRSSSVSVNKRRGTNAKLSPSGKKVFAGTRGSARAWDPSGKRVCGSLGFSTTLPGALRGTGSVRRGAPARWGWVAAGQGAVPRGLVLSESLSALWLPFLHPARHGSVTG
jgi:hypothetical protein